MRRDHLTRAADGVGANAGPASRGNGCPRAVTRFTALTGEGLTQALHGELAGSRSVAAVSEPRGAVSDRARDFRADARLVGVERDPVDRQGRVRGSLGWRAAGKAGRECEAASRLHTHFTKASVTKKGPGANGTVNPWASFFPASSIATLVAPCTI